MFSSKVSSSGDSTEIWIARLKSGIIFDQLARYGDEGVAALRAATPVGEGLTADSWTYEIIKDATSWSIVWSNTNVVDGTPVAVLLQHGHGTRNGGYVEGRDFINPALRPIFDKMADEAWKAVTR